MLQFYINRFLISIYVHELEMGVLKQEDAFIVREEIRENDTWADLRFNRIKQIKEDLEKGNIHVDQEIIESSGQTLLTQSIVIDRYEIFLLCLLYQANVNQYTYEGMRPVHLAASLGRLKMLQDLQQYGADLTVRDEVGMTALDRVIESPCQTLNRLNNLFSYLENNTYQCNYLPLSKLSFQKFKKFPIPQPFIDKESEYLSAAKQQPKQSQQIKIDLKLPDTSKNVESLKEFTSYVQSIRQQRKLKKFGQIDPNRSAVNFRTVKKDPGPQISPKLLRQTSTHLIAQVGKRRNAIKDTASPRPQSKYQTWAKDFFQKLENDQVRATLHRKSESRVWSLYHQKNYEKKLFEIQLKPQTEQAIKLFQKSLIEKIQE